MAKKIRIKVIPNSRKEEIIEKKELLTVKIKEPPEKNKANKAVIKLLSKKFNAKVKLISGEKNRKKIIEIEK